MPTTTVDPIERAEARVELGEIHSGELLSPEDAATRIAAYVYGNIVVLAALVSLNREDALTGHSALAIAGVAVSTFLTHVLAHGIGHRLHALGPLTWPDVQFELRGSLPILTSAFFPSLLMLITAATSIPGAYAQVFVGLFLVIRLGLLGALVAQVRGTPSSARIVAASAGLALLAAVVTTLKVLLGH